jgi:hypothetical protein
MLLGITLGKLLFIVNVVNLDASAKHQDGIACSVELKFNDKLDIPDCPNANTPMLLNAPNDENSFRDEQLKNAYLSIVVKLDKPTILDNRVHPLNAPLPIFCRVLGTIIDVIIDLLKNTPDVSFIPLLISITVFGICTTDGASALGVAVFNIVLPASK